MSQQAKLLCNFVYSQLLTLCSSTIQRHLCPYRDDRSAESWSFLKEQILRESDESGAEVQFFKNFFYADFTV